MAIGWTNRGRLRVLEAALQGIPLTGFHIGLITETVTPTADTKILGELEEIIGGNGYSGGGQPIARSLVGFPTSAEDDAVDKGSVIMRDTFFTATATPMPSAGLGIKFIVLLDDNATINNREVYAYAEFTGLAKILSIGEILSILDLKFSMEP